MPDPSASQPSTATSTPSSRAPSPSPAPTAEPEPDATSVTEEQCEPLDFAFLPHGEVPGSHAWYEATAERPSYTEWGSGDSAVTQYSATREQAPVALRDLVGDVASEFDPEGYPASQLVKTDLATHMIMPVSEWGLGMVQVRSIRADCFYLTYLPAGTTEEQANAFVEGMNS